MSALLRALGVMGIALLVMHELRLKQVLTTDRHFAQMGFHVLPDPAERRRR